MSNKKGWDLLIRSVERQNNAGVDPNAVPRKYKKPEKLVEKDVLAWAKDNGVHLHVVESKAIWSMEAGRFIEGQAEVGYPDLSGNNNYGHSIWIELKAKDKRHNLSPGQYQFLLNKIEQGCFAVVVDSAERVSEFYYTWLKKKDRQGYLTSILPVPSAIKKENDRFDPEMGF
jgi:hypothetical protein